MCPALFLNGFDDYPNISCVNPYSSVLDDQESLKQLGTGPLWMSSYVGTLEPNAAGERSPVTG